MDHIAESASLEQVENARFEPDTLYPRCQGNFRHELTTVSLSLGEKKFVVRGQFYTRFIIFRLHLQFHPTRLSLPQMHTSETNIPLSSPWLTCLF